MGVSCQQDLDRAGAWLRRYGLPDDEPRALALVQLVAVVRRAGLRQGLERAARALERWAGDGGSDAVADHLRAAAAELHDAARAAAGGGG